MTYVPTTTGQGSRSADVLAQATPVLTVAELKDNYLFGIAVRGLDGVEPPESFFAFHIANATAWAERELELSITPKVFTDEQHDYHLNDYRVFAFIQLNHWPLIEVTGVAARYPTDVLIYDFPLAWVKSYPLHGHIHLVPTAGTISQVIFSNGGSFIPLIYQQLSYLPNLWHVTYAAGFKDGLCPKDIADLIAKKAAIDVLHIAGEIIRGVGVVSESLGIDGLSQSVSTTKGQGNLFAHRIKIYQDEIKENVRSLREFWKGIKLQSL